MRRTVPLLIILMLVTSMVAGCFGGGEDDQDNDNVVDGGNGGGNNTTAPNNTTFPPEANEAPVPSFNVTFETGNNTTTANRVAVEPGSNVSLVFDGTASTDPDGEITRYAWTVTGPGGSNETGGTAVFRLNITGFSEYGAWDVTLKVLDDRTTIATMTQQIAFDYSNTFASERPMRGPGKAERESDETKSSEVGDPVGAVKVESGTYNTHDVTLGAGVSTMTIDGTYDSSGLGAELKIYLFAPGVSDDGTADAEPVAESEVGSDGSVSLTVDGSALNETGRYKIRVDLDGNGQIDNYSLDVLVEYALPQADDGHAHTH